jgi:hypothetical protein
MYAPPELRPLAIATLKAIAAARFAMRMSILAYAGPDGLTQPLLDTWTKAGLLHEGTVPLDPLSPVQTTWYALTTMGARELGLVTVGTVKGISTARLRRSGRKLAHDVLVGECVLAAMTLAKTGALELMGAEADDSKLTTAAVVPGPPPVRVPLRPDALVMVRTDRGPSAVLVEVDRGTISRERMQQKYAGYLAWHAQRGPERDWNVRALRVLTVVPSEARLNALHDAALAANHGRRSGLLIFALQRDIAAYHAERLLEPVARPLGADMRVPIFERKRSRDATSLTE